MTAAVQSTGNGAAFTLAAAPLPDYAPTLCPRLVKAIGRLRPLDTWGTALRLYLIDGLTERQTAERMQVNRSQARNYIKRGRARLREWGYALPYKHEIRATEKGGDPS